MVVRLACTGGTHRYPDGNALRLKECLSNKFQVDINCLTIGNGSNDIIEFIARSFLSDKDSAIYSEHAFAVYPLVVQAVGAEGIEVPAIEYGHDLEEMLKAFKGCPLLVGSFSAASNLTGILAGS